MDFVREFQAILGLQPKFLRCGMASLLDPYQLNLCCRAPTGRRRPDFPR
jgi:hypothetical protein